MADVTCPALRDLRDNKELRDRVLAECGVTRQALDQWLVKGVPAQRVPQVAKVLGVKLHQIRPDIFPPEAA